MKFHLKLHALLTLIVLIGTADFTLAQVPPVISYQGRITAYGTNFSGAGRFKFALIGSSNNAAITYWSNDGTSSSGNEPAGFVTVTVQPFAGWLNRQWPC